MWKGSSRSALPPISLLHTVGVKQLFGAVLSRTPKILENQVHRCLSSPCGLGVGKGFADGRIMHVTPTKAPRDPRFVTIEASARGQDSV